uniref:AAA+ ATPase domain-containing protein n=2 Tax=Hordeum vulgare subsp. vulgare TaxID=112509 RepID=A0A8I6Z247_HORVV
MEALLCAAQWVVGQALAPIADGLLEAWGASKSLGLNIEALKMELLLVKATLELAGSKQICGPAMEELLGKLRLSAHCAEDLLDELDYFRIHDQIHGTYDAANQHAKGGVHDLALTARHAAKSVGKLSFISSLCCSAPSPAGHPAQVEDARRRPSRCGWPRARPRSQGNSSSAPNANQELKGCMPRLGILLPRSSSPPVCVSGQPTLCGAPQRETPLLEFNRADFSERMNIIVEQLQPVRREVTNFLQSCNPMTVPDIAKSRPITTCQSIEPKLYGRDHIVASIIHDMTKGECTSKDLTVLPIVGPGGIGKTTLIQHIYHNKVVQNHFHVVIWVCVSHSFNLNKLLEEITKKIPPVAGEKGDRPEELIAQRLISKRFLLVLDDIWKIDGDDDWKRLLLSLKTPEGKGSVILLTTRFPAIAKKVKVTNPIELNGLESEEFRKLFLAFVFDNEPFTSDQNCLLEIGYKIMEKLKGSPLAAKTVGTLLGKDLSLRHWRRVLESKEWETQNDPNDIIPALKLSYDHLPFHQQQCFSYSALFPEDYKYSAKELINFWIGMDILQPSSQNQTLEDLGLSNLHDLVAYGFFGEEKTNGCSSYVIHDLLHDLALQVASHDCIAIHHSNVGLVEIQPSIHHMSIIIDCDDALSREKLKCQLGKMKTRLNVKQLHTLMLFGPIGDFCIILGDLFSEANALRVLRLVKIPTSVESMIHNFSSLIHLRYLCLGTKKFEKEIPLPLVISRFYHLKILDLGSWRSRCYFPRNMSNLGKLCHFQTPPYEFYSDIINVGNLKFLQELKAFSVNKESEGFEPKQLEDLAELRELGIYNLENIYTKEEAATTKLMDKNHLERLTLDWDSERANIEPDVEAVVLESLQPHRYVQDLCIRWHGGFSCPTWLGDRLAVEALESLHLCGVSWEYLPPLGKMWRLVNVILKYIAALEKFVIEQSFCMLIRLELVGLESFEKWVPSEGVDHMFPVLQVLIVEDCPKLLELPFSNRFVDPKPDQDRDICWLPKLQELVIRNCPQLLLAACIPWTETLRIVSIGDIKLLGGFEYSSRSSFLIVTGKDDLQSLDEVVAFNSLTRLEELRLNKCPPLQSKHFLLLTSLKKLDVWSSEVVVDAVGGKGDVEWCHPLEHLWVEASSGFKKLTELLTHLPRLTELKIWKCEKLTRLAVEMDEEKEEDDSGLLLLPTHLSDTLECLTIVSCEQLVLVDPSGAGRGLEALRSLRWLVISACPKVLSAKNSFSCCFLPPSLQILDLYAASGMGTLEPLSNLTSLTKLKLTSCGEDLRCKGLGPLLTTGAQLRNLHVRHSPGFFDGWHPSQLQDGAGEEQQLVSPGTGSSSKLDMLWTDEVMGLLAAPICTFLSSSLTELWLFGSPCRQEMERFTKGQEEALQLLASLQELQFYYFNKLQSLPAGLHKLNNLKKLKVYSCPAVRSLPEDGLPKSLQQLEVSSCGNEMLIQECRGLVGSIAKIN